MKCSKFTKFNAHEMLLRHNFADLSIRYTTCQQQSVQSQQNNVFAPEIVSC